MMSPAQSTMLRERLLAMRADLIPQLAAEPTLGAGLVRLLGDVGAALAALDAVQTDDAAPGERA